MTYTVIWLSEATAAFRRLRPADPDGAKRVAKAVAALADDPFPQASTALGGSGYRRLRFGNYRILYQVIMDDGAVNLLNVGTVETTRA